MLICTKEAFKKSWLKYGDNIKFYYNQTYATFVAFSMIAVDTYKGILISDMLIYYLKINWYY